MLYNHVQLYRHSDGAVWLIRCEMLSKRTVTIKTSDSERWYVDCGVMKKTKDRRIVPRLP